jgi:ribosomal protein L12E/L44/L45/RPP1/RPP2
MQQTRLVDGDKDRYHIYIYIHSIPSPSLHRMPSIRGRAPFSNPRHKSYLTLRTSPHHTAPHLPHLAPLLMHTQQGRASALPRSSQQQSSEVRASFLAASYKGSWWKNLLCPIARGRAAAATAAATAARVGGLAQGREQQQQQEEEAEEEQAVARTKVGGTLPWVWPCRWTAGGNGTRTAEAALRAMGC